MGADGCIGWKADAGSTGPAVHLRGSAESFGEGGRRCHCRDGMAVKEVVVHADGGCHRLWLGRGRGIGIKLRIYDAQNCVVRVRVRVGLKETGAHGGAVIELPMVGITRPDGESLVWQRARGD